MAGACKHGCGFVKRRVSMNPIIKRFVRKIREDSPLFFLTSHMCSVTSKESSNKSQNGFSAFFIFVIKLFVPFWTMFLTYGHVSSHLFMPLPCFISFHLNPLLLERGCTFSHASELPSLPSRHIALQPTSSKVVAVGLAHLLNTLSFQYRTYFVHVSSWCVIRDCDTGARKLILYTQTAYRQHSLVSLPHSVLVSMSCAAYRTCFRLNPT